MAGGSYGGFSQYPLSTIEEPVTLTEFDSRVNKTVAWAELPVEQRVQMSDPWWEFEEHVDHPLTDSKS